MSNEHSGEQTERTRDQGRSIAEWTTLAISLAIVLGVVGLILAFSVTDRSKPPAIVVEPKLDQVRQAADGYYLPVVIRNEGGRTVEDALVEVELALDDAEPETAELTVVFLAGGVDAEGTVVFTGRPARRQAHRPRRQLPGAVRPQGAARGPAGHRADIGSQVRPLQRWGRSHQHIPSS